jgi:hypothetical protein
MKAAASTRFRLRAVTTNTLSLPSPAAAGRPAYRVNPPQPEIDLWVYALTCSLPRKKNYRLLKILRDDLLAYLAWVTDELAQADPNQSAIEIQRTAERLREIAMLMPSARAAASADDIEETGSVWPKA